MSELWNSAIIGESSHTVDGRNPAPVDMENLPSFTGFHVSQVVSQISSINSRINGTSILSIFTYQTREAIERTHRILSPAYHDTTMTI